MTTYTEKLADIEKKLKAEKLNPTRKSEAKIELLLARRAALIRLTDLPCN